MKVCIIGKSNLEKEIGFMRDKMTKPDQEVDVIYLIDLKKENANLVKNQVNSYDLLLFITDQKDVIITYFYIGLVFGVGKNFKIASTSSIQELMKIGGNK
jgi:hypothetical protein